MCNARSRLPNIQCQLIGECFSAKYHIWKPLALVFPSASVHNTMEREMVKMCFHSPPNIRSSINEGVVSKKLWCCVGGEVVYKNLVLSTELIM